MRSVAAVVRRNRTGRDRRGPIGRGRWRVGAARFRRGGALGPLGGVTGRGHGSLGTREGCYRSVAPLARDRIRASTRYQ